MYLLTEKEIKPNYEVCSKIIGSGKSIDVLSSYAQEMVEESLDWNYLNESYLISSETIDKKWFIIEAIKEIN